MTIIKKGDFVELDYTGKLAEDGRVFDTTLPAQGKQLNPKAQFKPAIICIGEGHLLPGLDEALEGKGLGAHTITVPTEKAFGKKDAKLLKLVPANKFKEQGVAPFNGLEVQIDNHYGVIRSVSGGRVTVDFNHPLAGHDLVYEVEARRIVTAKDEQVRAVLEMTGLHHHGVSLEGEGHIVVKTHVALPQQVAQGINEMITRLTGVTTVTYHIDKEGHR